MYVEVCIGTDTTLGIYPSESNIINGRISVNGFKFIASLLRESHNASDNSFYALIYDGIDFIQSDGSARVQR